MTAEKKQAPARHSLNPDELDAARNYYLRRGATCKWVGEQFSPPVGWQVIETLARRLGWTSEKANLDLARLRRSKATADQRLADEVEQDERHAICVKREMDLRERLVEKAHQAVMKMTPAEALQALGRVSGFKDLQFVERLARGRSTDKTEAALDVADGFRKKLFEAHPDDVLETASTAGDDAPVQPSGGTSPEPVADKS